MFCYWRFVIDAFDYNNNKFMGEKRLVLRNYRKHIARLKEIGISKYVVNDAIKRKFKSLTEVEYKQIIIVTKEQYNTVLKPQMDILAEYNEAIDVISMVSKKIRKKEENNG